MAGLCNCCADPANAAIIVQNDGISLITGCLSSPVGKIVLNAVTALYYLCTPSTRKDILQPPVVEQLNNFVGNEKTDRQLKNTAKAFLEQHVTT